MPTSSSTRPTPGRRWRRWIRPEIVLGPALMFVAFSRFSPETPAKWLLVSGFLLTVAGLGRLIPGSAIFRFGAGSVLAFALMLVGGVPIIVFRGADSTPPVTTEARTSRLPIGCALCEMRPELEGPVRAALGRRTVEFDCPSCGRYSADAEAVVRIGRLSKDERMRVARRVRAAADAGSPLRLTGTIVQSLANDANARARTDASRSDPLRMALSFWTRAILVGTVGPTRCACR